MQTYAKNPESIQNYAPNTVTLAGVLSEKLIAWVRMNRVSKLFRKAVELAVGVLLGAFVVAPAQVASGLETLLKTNDFAVPKVVAVLVAFFGRKQIVRLFKRSAKLVQSFSAEPDEKLLDNIPVPELVDYLLRNKHFKREGVNGVRETFGLNMEKFNRLAGQLEKNKVLVRGENNSRVLAGHWSRQALIDYLSGYEKSAAMEPRFKVTRIGAGAKVRLDREEFEPATA